ncbi:ST7 protein [Capsaspora owczarzaki ATCC 30864]|uniref:Protein ST7 homolog n=1 Tax=Capsaspora owczarzaki (strain ATCC 30864) TaxID=595528 RepID=A0A0D2X0A3_CAPO3|nr:ST7 protein [Capsaspora owczarzaki ATCC 30864]KJE88709.1 ST7 protein [Capsaspora owczarzaki ATCC 30864]|eukprot:XP_004365175.2 ST7 protein [Capsaspora owczarzaki ATCC 30864]
MGRVPLLVTVLLAMLAAAMLVITVQLVPSTTALEHLQPTLQMAQNSAHQRLPAADKLVAGASDASTLATSAAAAASGSTTTTTTTTAAGGGGGGKSAERQASPNRDADLDTDATMAIEVLQHIGERTSFMLSAVVRWILPATPAFVIDNWHPSAMTTQLYISVAMTVVMLFLALLGFEVISRYWPAGATRSANGAPKATVMCKIIPNPMLLLRGAECNRYHRKERVQPLTTYDMSLTDKDQTVMFSVEPNVLKDPLIEAAQQHMTSAWKDQSTPARIQFAKEAVAIAPHCSTAWILLAEEDAQTVVEAEAMLFKAVQLSEGYLRRLSPHYFQDHGAEFWIRPETRPYIFAKRRLGMCSRKLGKYKEAAAIFRELLVMHPAVARSHLNVQSNLIELLLLLGQYDEVQKTLEKYEVVMEKSALLFYTAALLRVQEVASKTDLLNTDLSARGLSADIMMALDAIHKAVEFNPHIPQYLLQTKQLVLPPEHFVLRGDSEAVCYAFDHLPHWQKVKGALQLLQLTYEQTLRLIPKPLEKGSRFEPYPDGVFLTDGKILPLHHDVSEYPIPEIPWLLFLGGVVVAVIVAIPIVLHATQAPLYVAFVERLVAWFH